MKLCPEVLVLWADFMFYNAILWCFITLMEMQSSWNMTPQMVWKSEESKLELLTENINVF